MTSKVFHRKSNVLLPKVVEARGAWCVDASGKWYLDGGSSGAGLTCLGHGHPAVMEAVQDQLRKISFMHGALFTSDPLEELAQELIDHAPAGLDRAFFTSGGSEAIEAALMMTRQYAVESGQDGRRTIISRRNSFHGATVMTLAVGDAGNRKRPFVPPSLETPKIAPTYAYRDKRDDESLEAYGARIADELEQAILREAPGAVLAFIAETVVGSSSGALTPPPGYLVRIRDICNRHGVLLILDEVYCGLGRTGHLHACQADGVVPDILVVAKGLAAGYAPIGAVLVGEALHDAIAGGSGSFKGGFTHSGHILSCAAALAVQRTVRREGLLQNVVKQAQRLEARLAERFAQHPNIGEIRGRGLMRGLEIVADRISKKPFDATEKISSRLSQACMEQGLLCNVASGTIDGTRGEHVLLAPPFIVSDEEIDELTARLAAALDNALGRAR